MMFISSAKSEFGGEMPDVYFYDSLPPQLRIQIVQVWDETLGKGSAAQRAANEIYEHIVNVMRRELGQFKLDGQQRNGTSRDEWANTFLQVNDVDIALSMIELAGKAIERIASKQGYLGRYEAKSIAVAGIKEINHRLQEQGVGYQYSDGEIMRVDSQFLHAETVKPALALMHDVGYEGAQAEFLKAHEHYRHGDTKGALTDALKAFESAMQTICHKRGWEVDPKATSKTLIAIMFDKGLIPSYWQSHFSGLRINLESGVSTARNREGGHGQGPTITTVPVHLAGYVMHQTAAAIVFLVEAEKVLSQIQL